LTLPTTQSEGKEGYRPVPRPLAQGREKPHTVRSYSHDLVTFARWFEQTSGEDFEPQAVDSREIQEYKGYLLRRGLTPATVNRRLIALGSFLKGVDRSELRCSESVEVAHTGMDEGFGHLPGEGVSF
jgi:site-specific recombinase XerD